MKKEDETGNMEVLHVKEFEQDGGKWILAFWSNHDTRGYSSALSSEVKESISTYYYPKQIAKSNTE